MVAPHTGQSTISKVVPVWQLKTFAVMCREILLHEATHYYEERENTTMSLTWLLVAFFIALAFVLISIMKFKMHPFLSLMLGGIIMGVCCQMQLTTIASTLASGFGNTLGSIGIIILWGIVLGNLLHKSGCTNQIANLMLKIAGQKNSPLAVALTGYIVSIPVFFDAAFVILVNLVKQLSRKGKVPFITLVTSLGVGLIVTHAMVIPTPGPLTVVGNMGGNIGAFFVYGAIIALIAVFVAGVIYAKMLGNREAYKNDFANAFDDIEEVETTASKNAPSGGMGIFLIFFPILLILIGTLGKQMFTEGFMFQLMGFIGDKNIALMIGAIVAYAALRKFLEGNLDSFITDSAKDAGIIFLITGAGGSFGSIINATGIGDQLVAAMSGWTGATASLALICIAWLISQILRAAQGSTTVALTTTSAIFAPLVAGLGTVSPILVGLAICAGGIGVSLPNDSGFWVVNRFSKFSLRQTIDCWTIGGTVAGVTSLVVILILSFFQTMLPGLM